MPAFDKGRSEIGGETYQYVYYITEPQGKNFWTEFIRSKGFVLNKPMLTACFGKISTDAAWTKFYYMRSYDPARYFRTETLTDEDRALMRDYMERFREDVKYRGKVQKIAWSNDGISLPCARDHGGSHRTTALQASQGFTRPLPSAIVVIGYGLAFYL